ncbi:MAG: FadR/GntR family transcriptional regulator [Desulfovibrio sp.]
MALHIVKLKNNRMYQHVVAQIEEALVREELLPGDVLPSEMKLAEMFETSRGTVREALRVLEEKGLVDIRVGVGGGAVVREPDMDKIGERLDLLVRLGRVGFDHMGEFRESVEGIVASLAAERVDTQKAALLRKKLAEARSALERGDGEAFLRGDVAVHLAIAEAAENPLFLAVLRMVHENILGAFEQFRLSGAETLEENCRDLEALVESVAQGRAEDAARQAREHVRKYNTTMKAQHEQRKQRRKQA